MKKSLLALFIIISTFNFAQDSNNVSLLFHWEDTTLVGSSFYNNTYNETWGFVQGGKEYGIIGSTAGTHIFDVSDPKNSYLADFIPGRDQGPNIVHRDFHDYKGYLYIVSDEGNGSLQIADLQYLPDSVHVVYDSDSLIKRSHNIFIDTATAKLYACGVNGNGKNYNGIEVYSLANPVNPDSIGAYTTYYVHDIFVRNDTGFLNAGNTGGLQIVDFSDPSKPKTLSSLTVYPYQGYNHSGWWNEQGNLYAFADETWGMDIKLLDVSDLDNIEVLSTFWSGVNDTASIPHNLIFNGDHLYVSYYYDGLRIFDVSDPANPFQSGFYDCATVPHRYSYEGAWGVYPLLPSGIVLLSDMQNGFYVFDVSDALTSRKEITKELSLKVFPNPVKEQLNIRLESSLASQVQLSLMDIQGRVVLQEERNLNQGMNAININTQQLSKGCYLLRLQDEHFSHLQKIVIQ